MTTSHRKDLDSEWQRKGATLSDKTARKEYGLTQDEIVRAIRARKLQYREGSVFGNPWLRFLRREIETLVKRKHGDDYLKVHQAETELAGINRKLKQMKTQVAVLPASAMEDRPREKLSTTGHRKLTTLAAKEGMTPRELLGRLIPSWRSSKA